MVYCDYFSVLCAFDIEKSYRFPQQLCLNLLPDQFLFQPSSSSSGSEPRLLHTAQPDKSYLAGVDWTSEKLYMSKSVCADSISRQE